MGKSHWKNLPTRIMFCHISSPKEISSCLIEVEFVILDKDLARTLRKQSHRWGLIVSLERQMMRTLNLPVYVAKRWLDSASSPLQFTSGEIVNSLKELASILEQVSDETINYHLERVPNDIAQWVHYNIGDYLLSELLEEASGEPVVLIQGNSVEEALDDRKAKLEGSHAS